MNKVLNKILGVVGVIFLMLGLMSCGSTGSGGGGGPQADSPKTFDELAAMVKKIDVSGAQGFVLTGNKGTATTASRVDRTALAKAADNALTLEENSIYKVTDDGRLERVQVTDDMGNGISRGTVCPLSVRDLDALYAVFWFRIVAYGNVVPYLVHKPTGLAYRASELISSSYEGPERDFNYDRDATGNLFIEKKSGGNVIGLFKVDISGLGSGSLTAREIKVADTILSWSIDSSGTFIVYYGFTGDSTVFRYIDIASGTLTHLGYLGHFGFFECYKLISDICASNGSLFHSSDGKLYFVGGMPDNPDNYVALAEVFRIERGSDGKPVITEVGPLSYTTTSEGESMSAFLRGYWWANYRNDHYVVGGKEIFLVGHRFVIEVFPDQAKVIVHDLPQNELSDINNVIVSGNFIFFFGHSKTTGLDVVLRYDPVSLTATPFSLPPDLDMDLNHVKVLNSDTIWFEALRLSDQAKVIGKMASDGTVTIADVVATGEPQIIIMEAIHPTDFLVINGDMQEWSLDKRVQQDIAGDATIGDDLRYYSEQKSKTNYFGLVEFEGNDVSSDGITQVTIDNTYQIRIGSSSSEFRNLLDDTSNTLRNIGGIAAQGVAVEISVPLTALNGATFADINVARVKEELFGDVSTITPVKNGADWTLTIGMATPLGDATVEIALTGSYVLRFTKKTVAVIDNGVTRSNLTDVGGSIVYPVTDGGNITVVIPETAIDSPASLSPTEQSGGQLFDAVIDVMGN